MTSKDLSDIISKKVKNSFDVANLLFAQDLVGFVISKCDPSFEMPPIVNNLLYENCKPFNMKIRNAIKCILFFPHRKHRYPFKNLPEGSESIQAKYNKCSLKIHDNYFCKGFTITNFLYFCVDISVMAAAFHKYGMQEALYVTVKCISSKIEPYDSRKFYVLLDLVSEEFPCISDFRLQKAARRLKEGFELGLSPLKEIMDSIYGD